jgi:hypothetical protein
MRVLMSRHRRRTGKKLLGFKARGGTVYADRLGASAPERKPPRRTKPPDSQRGPTGEQQQELAVLCRLHGIKYPSPTTAAEVDALIARLRLRPVDGDVRDRSRGPDAEQQNVLAALCRQHGVKYPSPKTAAEAAEQIARLRDA